MRSFHLPLDVSAKWCGGGLNLDHPTEREEMKIVAGGGGGSRSLGGKSEI
jgi:hypothetical protein